MKGKIVFPDNLFIHFFFSLSADRRSDILNKISAWYYLGIWILSLFHPTKWLPTPWSHQSSALSEFLFYVWLSFVIQFCAVHLLVIANWNRVSRLRSWNERCNDTRGFLSRTCYFISDYDWVNKFGIEGNTGSRLPVCIYEPQNSQPTVAFFAAVNRIFVGFVTFASPSRVKVELAMNGWNPAVGVKRNSNFNFTYSVLVSWKWENYHSRGNKSSTSRCQIVWRKFLWVSNFTQLCFEAFYWET